MLEGGEGGGGGGHPPLKKFHNKNLFFAQNFPEGTIAAVGRQGVLEGGGVGVTPQKKIQFFFRQKLDYLFYLGGFNVPGGFGRITRGVEQLTGGVQPPNPPGDASTGLI